LINWLHKNPFFTFIFILFINEIHYKLILFIKANNPNWHLSCFIDAAYSFWVGKEDAL